MRLALALELDHQVQHLAPHGDVERGDRLIGDDELGIERERARDADALALAAGEFVRIAVEHLAGEPDGLEQRAHFLDLLGPRADAVHEQRLAHDLAHRHARIERGVGVLEDRLHVAAELEQLRLRRVREVLAFEEHAARRRVFEAHDGAPERRLSAPRFAHEPERLAFLHRRS